MNKKKKNRPTLRFPEFNGDWEETKLFNIILNISPPKKLKSSQFQENGKYPIIDQSQNDIAGYTDDEKALVKDEFPLIVFGDHTCTLKIIENPFVQGADGIKIFKGKIKVIDTRYLYHALQNEPFITKEYKRHYSILKEKIICFPKDYKEQQKIAACLSSLDDLITAHQEKLTNLKAHKKGLLQNLFPKTGEKVPRLRFDGFEGDWEIKLVDRYFDVRSSKRVLQKDWKNKGIPFYRTRELVSLMKNEPFGSEIFISEELFSELSEKYGSPIEGDFLVSGVGTLGVYYQVKANDKFYFKDGNVLWFKLKKDIVSDYFKFCFQSKFVLKQIFGQSSVSTVGTYTITNARKTEFWIPPTKKEQQKIAACLSALDDLITLHQKKLTNLKDHKKGLLQNLFPSSKPR